MFVTPIVWLLAGQQSYYLWYAEVFNQTHFGCSIAAFGFLTAYKIIQTFLHFSQVTRMSIMAEDSKKIEFLLANGQRRGDLVENIKFISFLPRQNLLKFRAGNQHMMLNLTLSEHADLPLIYAVTNKNVKALAIDCN